MIRLPFHLCALLLVVSGLGLVAAPAQARPDQPRPNVVLIYVDDMRADDLAYMDYTRSLFEGSGTSFSHAISPHPLCCPARAELMTGQYAQNNGVSHNRGEWGGYSAFAEAGMRRLVPQWYRSVGYRTAYLGKYLNGYARGAIRGVDVTDTLVRKVYSPYGFSTWNNGRITRRSQHTTDWVAARTSRLVARFSDDPFFITAAYLAPHAMKRSGEWVPPFRTMSEAARISIPPQRYRQLQPGDETPPSFSDPAFNEQDMSDKPSAVRDSAPLSPETVLAEHQARVLSLYAVDDAVERTVTALQDAGVYDDTILAFTSDNGFQLGEHRLSKKDHPYAESLRVPLLVRGPGVPVGSNDHVVTTVDIPGTLAALAGVRPRREQDGINAFEAAPERAVLIQSGADERRFDWRGVYTRRYTYVEHHTGEVESYDRVTDPHELQSGPLPGAARLAEILDSFRSCRGATCRASY